MNPEPNATPSPSPMVPVDDYWKKAPWFGKMFYHLIPFRRQIVLDNLRRVFGATLSEEEILTMAQSYWAHYARFFTEWGFSPFRSKARKQSMVRVENIESPIKAHGQGKGWGKGGRGGLL